MSKLFVVVLLTATAGLFAYMYHYSEECKSKGGAYIKTYSGYNCYLNMKEAK